MDVKVAIESRRAYRSLEPVQIDEKVVEELVHAVSLSPSCFNKQPWRMVFVTDPLVRAKLHETLNRGNEWFTAASMIIAVFTSKEKDCVIGPREYALFDTGMATAFLILRATELGLVAHPIAGFSPEAVKPLLNIPLEENLITLIGLGKKSNSASALLNEQQLKTELERPERLSRQDWAYRNQMEG